MAFFSAYVACDVYPKGRALGSKSDNRRFATQEQTKFWNCKRLFGLQELAIAKQKLESGIHLTVDSFCGIPQEAQIPGFRTIHEIGNFRRLNGQEVHLVPQLRVPIICQRLRVKHDQVHDESSASVIVFGSSGPGGERRQRRLSEAGTSVANNLQAISSTDEETRSLETFIAISALKICVALSAASAIPSSRVAFATLLVVCATRWDAGESPRHC